MRPFDPRLLRQVRAARWYVALTVGLGVAAAALIVAQALLIADLLTPVVRGDSPSGPALAWPFAGLALVIAGRACVAWAQERYALRAAARTIAELRRAVVEAWALRGPRAVGTTAVAGAAADGSAAGVPATGGTTAVGGAGAPASGSGSGAPASGSAGSGSGASPEAEVATLATRGLDALEPYLVRYVPQLVLTALLTPALVGVVLGLDWVSAVILIVTLPLVPMFMVLVGRLTAGTSERRLATVERLGTQVLDLVAGLPTLRAFGRSFGPGERVRALGDASRKATMGTLRVAFLSSMVLELLTTLSVAIIAVGVGLRLVEGAMELQPAIAVLVLAPEVYLPLRRVGAEFHASVDGVAAAARAFALVGPDGSGPPKGADVPAPRVAGGELVLEGVSVRAVGRGVVAPAGLSARIPLGANPGAGGRVVALRGPSGSGKSTAVLVVLGLLAPDAGRVGLVAPGGAFRDLADPRASGLESWWSALTWVPQRPSLPPGRLREVVLDGTSRVSDRALTEAARLTGLDAVVGSLPDGWDTRVGLGGVGLSVGQRQRVALTSALLDDAATKPLVILDEPTAHLDARGEQGVLDTVRAWRDAGRTVLVVAHRASLLGLADQVIDVRSVAEPEPVPDPEPGPEPVPALGAGTVLASGTGAAAGTAGDAGSRAPAPAGRPATDRKGR
ncbi:thiol reductant ABC exporter subunit CydD [Promicromonospora sp. NPDC023987]|uniref:thiol reductant ABC exporter subunit CydD n=1 Tax=Promicromonospora sp. NPDC023987 TaxID=3155360 RepID=UPI0033ECCDD9